MDIEIFTTPGLGDTSYLIASDGEAALVDPQRDAWRFLAVAEERGWRVTHVLETHVHNDYLSGALETRAATGAIIVAPARGGYAFPHRGADEGTEVSLGALRLTAMATPGHTPEHIAWAIHDGGFAHDTGGAGDMAPAGIFTGGSLLVGTAGRTDLLGPDRTAELTVQQAATLRRLGALPAGVRVLPTHGAGSFCSVGPAAASIASTVGRERDTNPVLGALGGADFAGALLGGLGRYPTYYAHMAPINRAGPLVLGGAPTVPALDPDALALAVSGGSWIVDGRPRTAFAAGHLPGALNVELDDSFAAYVGWLIPFEAPIVLVMPEPIRDSTAVAAMQLLRIGYERLIGVLDGGSTAWAEAGRQLRRYETTTIENVYDETRRGVPAALLDVRQPVEWRDDGIIPGARTIFVADLPGRLGELPRDREITVMCKSGSRAAMAASILDAAGIPVRLVAGSGAPGWTGRFAALPVSPTISPPTSARSG
ncbi:MAG: rhodanese-like domain-containing protein [Chloroflexota bacterium]